VRTSLSPRWGWSGSHLPTDCAVGCVLTPPLRLVHRPAFHCFGELLVLTHIEGLHTQSQSLSSAFWPAATFKTSKPATNKITA